MGAELLTRSNIIEKLRITVDCGNRIWKGEWQVRNCNRGIRWLFPIGPTSRGYTKSASYVSKMRNCDLRALSVQADFGDIPDVKQASVANQERIKDRINSIGNAVAILNDTFASYLTREVDMFSGWQIVERAKMLNGTREIARSNARGECLNDPNARLG